MLAVEDAIALVLRQAQPLDAVRVPLKDVVAGSVLAEDAKAPDPLPPFPASIMDGYAVVAADGEGVLEVVGRITAGADSDAIKVKPGQAAYITTGAKVPAGADAVVKVEDTASTEGDAGTFAASEKSVRILKGVKPGASIRPTGYDVKQDETVLLAGDVINAAEVGLLATVGVSSVAVIPRPVVGVMSTGDELVEPDAAALSGSMIRDSNRYSLLAAVTAMGATAVDLGIVRDKETSLKQSLQDAVSKSHCDIIITSGGVSMGEADLLKPALEELGTIHFGRVCMKPGKPTTFAIISPPPSDEGTEGRGRSTLVFALPGNPVSCLVTTHLFVWPALQRLGGRALPDCLHPQVDVRVASPITLDPQRAEYHRAQVRWDGVAGVFVAASTGNQMSSRLLSMKSANALLCLPASSGTVAADEMVPALLIGHLPAPPPATCFHHAAALVGTSPAAGGAVASATEEGAAATTSSSSYVSFSAVDEAGAQPSDATPHAQCGCSHSHDHGQNGSQGHSQDHSHAHDHAHSHAHSHGTGSNGGSGGGKTPRPLRLCLLTVSDRASAGVYEDLSGPAMLAAMMKEGLPFKAELVESEVVADEAAAIADKVTRWADGGLADVVLTSGGTGFGPRDGTPEAIRPLLDKEAPGLVQAILEGGLRHTPFAVLSRPIAGVRKATLIVTLPGSVKAVRENIETLAPLLPRIVNLMRGDACH